MSSRCFATIHNMLRTHVSSDGRQHKLRRYSFLRARHVLETCFRRRFEAIMFLLRGVERHTSRLPAFYRWLCARFGCSRVSSWMLLDVICICFLICFATALSLRSLGSSSFVLFDILCLRFQHLYVFPAFTPPNRLLISDLRSPHVRSSPDSRLQRWLCQICPNF